MIFFILALIVGLPFSALFFHNIDIWHAQGFYTQVVLCLAFGFLLSGCAKQRVINNWPLFWFFIWSGIVTAAAWYGYLVKGKYHTEVLFPFLNLSTILLLYFFITGYVMKRHLVRIVQALEFLAIFNALLCVLQYFGISQYTKLLFPSNHIPHNPMVGIIGNGTHNAVVIALLIPILLIRQTRQNNYAVALSLILLFLTGESKGELSATGLLMAAVAVWFIFFRKHTFLIAALAVSGYFAFSSKIMNVAPKLLESNGRLEVWKYVADLIQHGFPLTGVGMGAVRHMAGQDTPLKNWAHLHNEYLQSAFEIGIIGFVLICWVVLDVIKTKDVDKTAICLKASLLSSLIACFFLSPLHLWVTAVLIITIYSLYKVHAKEGDSWVYQEKKFGIEF